MPCSHHNWNSSLGIHTSSQIAKKLVCTVAAGHPTTHVVELENLFLHQVSADCEGVLIAGSGDVEFIAASPAFTVQAYDWKRANLVIPAATKNLFTTTSQSVHLRHALFSHVRTGMEQVRVDVQATSPGFSGTLTVSAWFDISS